MSHSDELEPPYDLAVKFEEKKNFSTSLKGLTPDQLLSKYIQSSPSKSDPILKIYEETSKALWQSFEPCLQEFFTWLPKDSDFCNSRVGDEDILAFCRLVSSMVSKLGAEFYEQCKKAR